MAYGLNIAKGMLTTLKHVARPPITVQFPDEERDIPPRARTNLVWFVERCTGCSTCAQACPDGCILVETDPREDGSYLVKRYEIDFRLCMYCGLCTEACPYEAIQVGGSYTNVQTDPTKLYTNKETLIELANEYLEQHDWVYPNGQQAVRQWVHPATERQHH
jgi:NADH-quinone oxidoreductase subunit I